MNAGFPHHAVECGQPRKCVLHSPGYRRRGRNGSPSAVLNWKQTSGNGRPQHQSRREDIAGQLVDMRILPAMNSPANSIQIRRPSEIVCRR